MRILFHIALVASILFLPWWVTAIVMLVACFLVSRFYEVIVYAVVFDALYAPPDGFNGLQYVWVAYASVSLLVASFLRSRLSW